VVRGAFCVARVVRVLGAAAVPAPPVGATAIRLFFLAETFVASTWRIRFSIVATTSGGGPSIEAELAIVSLFRASVRLTILTAVVAFLGRFCVFVRPVVFGVDAYFKLRRDAAGEADAAKGEPGP
jgi:hypothetical protein